MINNSCYSLITQRRNYKAYGSLQPFYHIAAMGDWKNIVTEQISIIRELKIHEPICGLLGTKADLEWAKKQNLNIKYHDTNLQQYETPTLKLLYDWSHSHCRDAVLYFHTKGASKPIGHNIPTYWRYLMTDYLIKDYEHNLKMLNLVDIIGVDYVHNAHSHFSGNFWMARCDWINQLIGPWQHRRQRGFSFGGHPWERLHAEFWVCSKKNYIAESLCCTNQVLYRGHQVFDIYKTKE